MATVVVAASSAPVVAVLVSTNVLLFPFFFGVSAEPDEVVIDVVFRKFASVANSAVDVNGGVMATVIGHWILLIFVNVAVFVIVPGATENAMIGGRRESLLVTISCRLLLPVLGNHHHHA